MSLDPRSVALQGLGASLLAFALQGLVSEPNADDAESDFAGSGLTPRRHVRRELLSPAHPLPQPKKRARRRRQADILFLGH